MGLRGVLCVNVGCWSWFSCLWKRWCGRDTTGTGTGVDVGVDVRAAAESKGCEVICCAVCGTLLRWVIAVCHLCLCYILVRCIWLGEKYDFAVCVSVCVD